MDKILAALILAVIATLLYNWYVDRIEWLRFRGILIVSFVLAFVTLTLPKENVIYVIAGCGYILILLTGCLLSIIAVMRKCIKILR